MNARGEESEERTRTPLDAHVAGKGRVVAFWEGGFAECALPDGGEIRIGRSRDADLSVQHPTVSREHAVLQIGSPPVLVDCGSSNGTKVGGEVVPAGGRREVLPGQLIELGSAVIAIQPAAAPEATGEVPSPNLEELIGKIAQSDISVIVVGETGVGKELTAEKIHARSKRADRPLLRLNCAALVDTLVESELFGHERGAFTGAHRAKTGLLEAANGGTLFLDEVAELAPHVQAKLLRVLESGEVTRVGSVAPRHVDVRFVSATNESIDALVATGEFRRDLYFPLAGMVLFVPPLRDRRREIPALARELLRRFCEKAGRPLPEISREALALLGAYGWPGNIRELRNVVERAAVLANAERILPEHVQVGPSVPPPPPSDIAAARGEIVPRAIVQDLERRRIIEALEQTNGNQTAAAALLGVSRRTLINRIEAFDLPRPRKRLD